MSEENLYTFENPEYRKTYWHTCSHVMAQAVKRLWPEVQASHWPLHCRGLVLRLRQPLLLHPGASGSD